MSAEPMPFSYEGAEADPIVKGAEHHLYIVELIGIGVKVGISVAPSSRVMTHRRDASAYGRAIGRVWISLPHVEARENERALVRSVGPSNRREYLPITFESAVKAAAALPRTRADRAAHERQVGAATDFFKAFITGGRA